MKNLIFTIIAVSALISTIFAENSVLKKNVKIEKDTLNEEKIKDFPGAFAFIADSKFLFIPKLNPLINRIDSFSDFSHSNVTFIKNNNIIYVLIARHIFHKNIQIERNLRLKGFNVVTKKDLIISKMEDVKPEFFIDKEIYKFREDIFDIPCIIEGLNFFDNDTNTIYKYKIYSRLYYISQKEKDLICKNIENNSGKSYFLGMKKLYLVYIPKYIYPEILGMSGSSVCISLYDKEYFFGIVSGMIFFNERGKVFIVVQRVEEQDLD